MKNNIHPENFSREIQVSGNRHFPESNWREAILYYLFGVWGNKQEVMYRPKINFYGFTLRLNELSYEAYTNGSYVDDGDMEQFKLEAGLKHEYQVLNTTTEKKDVEIGLIRFVKDDAIRILTIVFEDGSSVAFSKQKERGKLGTCSQKLQSYLEYCVKHASSMDTSEN